MNVNATSSIGLVPNIITHHAHANGTEERYSSTEEEEEERPQTPAKSDVISNVGILMNFRMLM